MRPGPMPTSRGIPAPERADDRPVWRGPRHRFQVAVTGRRDRRKPVLFSHDRFSAGVFFFNNKPLSDRPTNNCQYEYTIQ
jgi:hypothetical protein